jgi:hypothetical protein
VSTGNIGGCFKVIKWPLVNFISSIQKRRLDVDFCIHNMPSRLQSGIRVLLCSIAAVLRRDIHQGDVLALGPKTVS